MYCHAITGYNSIDYINDCSDTDSVITGYSSITSCTSIDGLMELLVIHSGLLEETFH